MRASHRSAGTAAYRVMREGIYSLAERVRAAVERCLVGCCSADCWGTPGTADVFLSRFGVETGGKSGLAHVWSGEEAIVAK